MCVNGIRWVIAVALDGFICVFSKCCACTVVDDNDKKQERNSPEVQQPKEALLFSQTCSIGGVGETAKT